VKIEVTRKYEIEIPDGSAEAFIEFAKLDDPDGFAEAPDKFDFAVYWYTRQSDVGNESFQSFEGYIVEGDTSWEIVR